MDIIIVRIYNSEINLYGLQRIHIRNYYKKFQHSLSNQKQLRAHIIELIDQFSQKNALVSW